MPTDPSDNSTPSVQDSSDVIADTGGVVRLVNAVFYAHHGTMQEEHRLGGRYEVDVSMKLDFERAATTDELEHTVDYEDVYNLIEKIVTTNRFYLIEKLAYLIVKEMLEQFDLANEVEVTVRKPNPPVGGTCDRAEVQYSSHRASDDEP